MIWRFAACWPRSEVAHASMTRCSLWTGTMMETCGSGSPDSGGVSPARIEGRLPDDLRVDPLHFANVASHGRHVSVLAVEIAAAPETHGQSRIVH